MRNNESVLELMITDCRDKVEVKNDIIFKQWLELFC